MINFVLGQLPLVFGNISIITAMFVVLYFVSMFILEGGIVFLKFLLAADDENAPDFNIKNPLFLVLARVVGFFKGGDLCRKFEEQAGEMVENRRGVWYAKSYNGGYLDKKLCSYIGTYIADVFANKNEAKKLQVEYLIKEAKRKGEIKNRWWWLLTPLLLDVVIVALEWEPVLTLVLLSSVTFVFSIRWIAKKLYKNMKKTSEHEERITDLENH